MCIWTQILFCLNITFGVDTERQDSWQVNVMRKELEEIGKETKHVSGITLMKVELYL